LKLNLQQLTSDEVSMRTEMLTLLLALQAFHVLFLLFHDWIPLGSLNNIAAVRAENSGSKLVIATAISTSFFLFGFIVSAIHYNGPYPNWLLWYLLISYLFLFYGELTAWWIPYFGASQPERAARYQTMFANTHSFLPARNGIPLNTLHILLHAFTLATIIVIITVMAT
jgi:hypothetical protein